MSKTKISEYSATANSNTDVGGINIDEGCAPSGINDAIRTLMAQLKNFQTGTGGDSFNGPVNGTVGATTPSTGAFTSITASGDITIDNGSADGGQLLLASSGYSNWGVDNYSGNFRWYYNTTEKMRLDNAGNLGLGVTPSAWGSNRKAIQVGGSGVVVGYFTGSATNTIVGNNFYNDGTNVRYVNAAVPAQAIVMPNDGSFAWAQYTGNLGAGNIPSLSTTAMTLDASGNLGVGTTSPSYKLHVVGGQARIDVSAASTSLVCLGTGSNFQVDHSTSGYATLVNSANSGAAMIFKGSSESMRIDTSGNLLVGTTSTPNGTSVSGTLIQNPNTARNRSATTVSSQVIHWSFYNGNGEVGGIYTNGSATTFYTSSDYRLKENVSRMTGALDKVTALNPVTYKWKVDGTEGQGFIAHELQAVIPDAVKGEKDAVDADGNPEYQGIDTSFLVATLTAAIQELNAKFEAYKAAHP